MVCLEDTSLQATEKSRGLSTLAFGHGREDGAEQSGSCFANVVGIEAVLDGEGVALGGFKV